MKLKSYNCLVVLLMIIFTTSLSSEEKIDIWKNKEKKKTETQNLEKENIKESSELKSSQTIKTPEKIQIQESSSIDVNEQKVYGIYDPETNNFNLNMWSTTKAEDLRSSLKRLSKIELSQSSNEILESILLSFSYPPQGMTEKEFVDLKINWLIKNDRANLIESFLKQN